MCLYVREREFDLVDLVKRFPFRLVKATLILSRGYDCEFVKGVRFRFVQELRTISILSNGVDLFKRFHT